MIYKDNSNINLYILKHFIYIYNINKVIENKYEVTIIFNLHYFTYVLLNRWI